MTLLPTQTLHCHPPDRSAPSLMEEVFRLYERALDATSTGIVIADATQPDHPLVYCNRAFERITGDRKRKLSGGIAVFARAEPRSSHPPRNSVRPARRA